MTKYIPGSRWGMLTIRWREEGKYAVTCDCGNEVTITTTQLSTGKEDCGCRGECQVYFIRARISDEYDYMKIGKTHGNVYNRLAVVQTHFPLPVRLERLLNGKENLERVLHHHFRHFRINQKREWFYFTPEMLTFIPKDAHMLEDNTIGVGNPELLGI